MRLARVLGMVFRNAGLRRLELAFAGFNCADWGAWIAMLVYAYDQGGTTTAGVVAAAQLVPAGVFAPFAAVLADRRGAARVLALGYVVQAAALAATAAALLAGGPPLLAYALAAVAATAVTVARPAQASLAPVLARTAEELTATNVVSGWVEGLSVLAAPAAAGLLLAVSGPGAVFAVMAAAALAAAILVAPLGSASVPSTTRDHASPGPLGESVAGFRALAKSRDARVLVSLLGAQFVAIGALDVLFVVLAIGVLGLGGSGAGYLNAAFGAGGALGIAVTVLLVGRTRLAPPLLAGAAVWSLAFAGLALWPTTAGALALLALAGAGRTVVDVAGRTLLQRTAPPEVLSRVFGVLEGLTMAGFAVGSLLTPLFVALAGGRWALAGAGAILPLPAVLCGRRLLEVDERATVPVVELALLRSVPIFAPLDAPTLETLARSLALLKVAAGTTVIREGDVGDRYLVVADGRLDVSVDGAHLATHGRGDGFGEIALLHEGLRTATVVAQTDALLYALDKAAFVAAVTGHPESARTAGRLVAERLEAASRPA